MDHRISINELLERAIGLTADHWGHCVDLPEGAEGKGKLVDDANDLLNLVQQVGFALIAGEQGLIAGNFGAFSPADTESNDNGDLQGERVLPAKAGAHGNSNPDISVGIEK
jgi:hypothetical protein